MVDYKLLPYVTLCTKARRDIKMKKPVRIVEPVDGAILNRHYGELTKDGLRIKVLVRTSEGFPSRATKVTVNDVIAEPIGPNEFSCFVNISEKMTRIIAKAQTATTTIEDSIVVLFDKNSMPRYRLSVDDNILFLRDLAKHSDIYHSIFDSRYLSFWKGIHERYNTKVHFNIYYQTPDGFNLSMLPDKFKSEWQDNSDWLRLTFHALQDEPPNPYINASYREVEHDFLLVTNEIIRFAGDSLLSTFTTIHWAEATKEGCRALRDHGIKGLVGYFTFRDGKPFASYYLNKDQIRYLECHDCWWDKEMDLFFIRHDIVLNMFEVSAIVPKLEEIAKEPKQREIMEVMIHEQYFCPELVNLYQPDAQDKVIKALEWLSANGYKSVFYDEGFLGAPEC